jgi:hypothetical protein
MSQISALLQRMSHIEIVIFLAGQAQLHQLALDAVVTSIWSGTVKL